MMKTVEFVTKIEDGKIEVPEQYRAEGSQVRVLLFRQDARRNSASRPAAPENAARRQLGQDRGLFEVPEDFDAPLSNDILRSFEE